MHTYNLSSQGEEGEGVRNSKSSWLSSEFEASKGYMTPCLNKNVQNKLYWFRIKELSNPCSYWTLIDNLLLCLFKIPDTCYIP